MSVENTSNSIYNLIRAIEKFPTFVENEDVRGTIRQRVESKSGDEVHVRVKGEEEEEDDDIQKYRKDDEESLPTSGIPKNMSGSILKVGKMYKCVLHLRHMLKEEELLPSREVILWHHIADGIKGNVNN